MSGVDYESESVQSKSGPVTVAAAATVSVADTYNNMGMVENRLGNFQKALDLYEKALEIKIKSLGGAHERGSNL